MCLAAVILEAVAPSSGSVPAKLLPATTLSISASGRQGCELCLRAPVLYLVYCVRPSARCVLRVHSLSGKLDVIKRFDHDERNKDTACIELALVHLSYNSYVERKNLESCRSYYRFH